ncbi:hypothetical protein BBJ28_00004416 [Nothophytophthora sp. Chile5]|nr:hypothetical protein BBJ28_00004416 [Nothophytophthora sp. Chile5]
MIRTLRELVAPEDVGPTLPHEHVLQRIDAVSAPPAAAAVDTAIRPEDLLDYRQNPWAHGGRNMALQNEDEAFRELERLHLLADGTAMGNERNPLVVDVTLPVEGRNAFAQERLHLAERLTGLHLVAVTTFESARLDGARFEGLTPHDQSDRVAKILETELVFGIGSDGESSAATEASAPTAYPGAMYQQINSADAQLDNKEQVIAKGLALAQARTHAPLYLSFSSEEASNGGVGSVAELQQLVHNWLRALMDAGAESKKLIICHADRWCQGSLDCANYDFLLSLFKLGVTVLFDTIGLSTVSDVMLVNSAIKNTMGSQQHVLGDEESQEPPPDSRLAKWVASFAIQHKYLHQILLSTNVHQRIQYRRYGGGDYTYVFEYFQPRLQRLGITMAQWDQLVRGNAVDLLAWYVPPEAPPIPKNYLQCTICGNFFEPIEGEYFTKFAFIYCSTKCLRRHSRQKFATPPATA